MPEVVEIRRYADFIRKHMKDKTIKDITILNGRYKKHGPFEGYNYLKKADNLSIIDVKSKGKLLYMILNNNTYLMVTLGLSGGFVYNPRDTNKYIFPNLVEYLNEATVKEYQDKSLQHLNIKFSIREGDLYFFDTLSYGTIKLAKTIEELTNKLNRLGPDIMDLDTTVEIFSNRIKKYKNKKIGIVLMDQKVVSGIGNYLRADCLWLAKISPFRLAKDLDDHEIERIYQAGRVLTWGEYDRDKAIRLGILRKSDKLPKDYGREFFVYFEEEDIYGNKVTKEELYEGSQKRFIYWVKKIQK
jgi:formamidopyrimidine-DNA glycosylase